MCLLTLGGQVLPHHELVDAIESALARSTIHERRNGIKNVFDRFGHVYASSVEMGGMKYVTRPEADGGEVRVFCVVYRV